MPIAREDFLTRYQQAMDEGIAAVFIGAGLSTSSGFVDWKGLLRDIATELNLDVDIETDLIALAQYHYNKVRNRATINQKLIEEFTKDTEISNNHHLLASLPIATFWTTNYDHLLEDAFKFAHKRLDIKHRILDFPNTLPKRDAVIYKMHGDISNPNEAILTKSDYESFDKTRQLFSLQLQGDLLSKTMLFIGFSFNDPNINYILARVRILIGENVRPHYWITRNADTDPRATERDKSIQKHRIEDLKTYGIATLLIDDYKELTDLLIEINKRVHRKNVFLSGSAITYVPFEQERALSLLRKLGTAIIENGFNLVSGMGLGVGDAIAMGAIESVYRTENQHLDERAILRPFPQYESDPEKRACLWGRYRTEMIALARSIIIVFGNKRDGSGNLIIADGVEKEFAIAKELGLYPIPIGCTGYAAQKIHKEISSNLEQYYGNFATKVSPHLAKLSDDCLRDEDIISSVIEILKIVSPK